MLPFLSLSFWASCPPNLRFAGLPILRVLPQLGTANQRTQPSIFFDRVTLGMRGLVFTTEGLNQLTPKVHSAHNLGSVNHMQLAKAIIVITTKHTWTIQLQNNYRNESTGPTDRLNIHMRHIRLPVHPRNIFILSIFFEIL